MRRRRRRATQTSRNNVWGTASRWNVRARRDTGCPLSRADSRVMSHPLAEGFLGGADLHRDRRRLYPAGAASIASATCTAWGPAMFPDPGRRAAGRARRGHRAALVLSRRRARCRAFMRGPIGLSLLAIVLFGIALQWLGLVAAVAVLVLVGAQASREVRPLETLALAAVMIVFSVGGVRVAARAAAAALAEFVSADGDAGQSRVRAGRRAELAEHLSTASSAAFSARWSACCRASGRWRRSRCCCRSPSGWSPRRR